MTSLLSSLSSLISLIGNGLGNFIDLLINLPSLIYNLVNSIPNPLFVIVSAFIGYFILILFIKVVSHFV